MSSKTLINIDFEKEKRKEYDKERTRPLFYKEKRKGKTFCICCHLVRRRNMYLHIFTKNMKRHKKAITRNISTIQQGMKYYMKTLK
jgi:hypothetical protein